MNVPEPPCEYWENKEKPVVSVKESTVKDLDVKPVLPLKKSIVNDQAVRSFISNLGDIFTKDSITGGGGNEGEIFNEENLKREIYIKLLANQEIKNYFNIPETIETELFFTELNPEYMNDEQKEFVLGKIENEQIKKFISSFYFNVNEDS